MRPGNLSLLAGFVSLPGAAPRLFSLLAYQLSFRRNVKFSLLRQPIEAEKQALLCHYLPSIPFAVFADKPVTIDELPIRRRRFAFLPLMRWLPQQRCRLTLPLPVTFTRLLKPLCVFCFGT